MCSSRSGSSPRRKRLFVSSASRTAPGARRTASRAKGSTAKRTVAEGVAAEASAARTARGSNGAASPSADIVRKLRRGNGPDIAAILLPLLRGGSHARASTARRITAATYCARRYRRAHTHHSREAMDDEARRRAGRESRRQVGGVPGARAGVRPGERRQRAVAGGGRRQLAAAPADACARRREGRRLVTRQPLDRLLGQA